MKPKPKEHPKFKCSISGNTMTISWNSGWITLFQDEAVELLDILNEALTKLPSK